eukprot:CAMPEP_0197653782 /NCGR_PEP_ID=MMETSP1338-20131121/37108_1 /TAXON_ID=43686 ORGANISM="Pelagodinium beii, Strain RCC1491" /NCGR_SAMPLE_ID=MMETSP1338 /ASSEMBLY_ACC=CAM_ASM_000754 /LENGTH=159 /DNA_ID=CAMNT_0043229021 /DNA_START=49 /DNA_END=528 /DNA_ORIENTATION=+
MVDELDNMMDIDEDFHIQQHELMEAHPPVPTPAQKSQWQDETDYSEKYCDDIYEYRRVTVPRPMMTQFPPERTMEEHEWRDYGITMSRGWEHYDHHQPEANVLLFRRVLGTDPKTGQIPPEMATKVEARKCYITELEQARQRMLQEEARAREQHMSDMF